MKAIRTLRRAGGEWGALAAALTCCAALLLGLAAVAAGLAAWLRGGLMLGGLVLLGVGGGLLVAHVLLDERRPRATRRK